MQVFEEPATLPYDINDVMKASSIREFDEAFTCKTFGFPSHKEYYTESSLVLKPLEKIQIPMLFLNARDDPFAPAECECFYSKWIHYLVFTSTNGWIKWQFNSLKIGKLLSLSNFSTDDGFFTESFCLFFKLMFVVLFANFTQHVLLNKSIANIHDVIRIDYLDIWVTQNSDQITLYLYLYNS